MHTNTRTIGRRPRAALAMLAAGALALVAAGLGCGLDALVIQKASNEGHVVMPDAQDSVVVVYTDGSYFGAADACATALGLTVYQPSGASEEGAEVRAPTEANPYYQVHFDGTGEYRALVLSAEQGGQQALGIVPAVPRQDSVLAPEKWYVFGTAAAGDGTISMGAPVMNPLGLDSTVVTLLLSQRAADLGLSLGGLPQDTLVQAFVDANVLAEASEFRTLVGQVLQCGKSLCNAGAPFGFPAEPPTDGSPAVIGLAPDFAAQARAGCADLSGLTVETFDTIRRVVSDQVTLQFNYDPDRIKVVWQADLTPGLTRNCSLTNVTKWLDDGALNDPNRTMFITGGVHIDTPNCGEGRTTFCLSADERARINSTLGNNAEGGWQPNVTRMYDDGTNGDVVAGDNVWTFVLEVPYWDPADAPDGAGLRLNYKFTWGQAKSVWTGTEEWPGNARLLEIVDLNGDHLVVRRDLFGDETTNKDKQNLLSPARGGCGVVVWEAVQAANPDYADCTMDSRERMYDSDGDCTLDTWPTAPTVLPAVLPSASE